MTDTKNHPEQDPAEGSREMIERDLQRQEGQADDRKAKSGDGTPSDSAAGAEAAEPSPTAELLQRNKENKVERN